MEKMMKASELKREIDAYIARCDEGDCQNGARRFLNDFAEDLFPALAERRARLNAIAKLTPAEVKLLGLDNEQPRPLDDSEDSAVTILAQQIARFTKSRELSNSRDKALKELLDFVNEEENDI
jgi:hypothetical protein